MNWVVSQKMPIFHFIIWRSTQENSPLFSFTCDMVGSYCWINNDVLKNEDDAEIFHNIKSQSVWAICPSTNPFYKWNRIRKIHFIQKIVVNLVLQYFCKMLPMEKETLCYRMGFTKFFLLAVKNHVPWVSLLFSVTIRDCCWGIKTFPGDFVLVSYNIGDGRKTQSLVVLSSRGLFRTSWVFVHKQTSRLKSDGNQFLTLTKQFGLCLKTRAFPIHKHLFHLSYRVTQIKISLF